MKHSKLFVSIGIPVLLLLGLVASSQAQGAPISFASGLPFQIGLEFCVGTNATCPAGVPALAASAGSTSNFNVIGLQSFIVVYQPAGTTSACTFTLDGVNQLGTVTTGSIISSQSCTSAGSFATSSATQNAQAKLSFNITTTGSVIFTVYGCTSTGGCGGGVGSTVSVSNFPSSQNVVCTSGCAGANPNGQALMAASAPVVIASNQSSVAVTAAQPTAANLNATVVQGTGSNLHTAVDSLPALPSGTNSIGGVTTQPSGFGSSPLGGQASVTASAVALPSNATHQVCIYASSSNTIPVYVGGSGVTTSGFGMQPGDFFCWQVSNSNLLYLIASTTGATISWTAL